MTGLELRNLRLAADLTQAELGKMLDYERRQISKWENGVTEIPKPVAEYIKQVLLVEFHKK